MKKRLLAGVIALVTVLCAYAGIISMADNLPEINAQNDTIEFEDYDLVPGAGDIPNQYASGGVAIRYSAPPLTQIVQEFSFNVTGGGNFNFQLYAANDVTLPVHLSKMYITVNNGEEITVDTTNFDVFDPENLYLDTTFNVKQLKYKNKITLNKGINTITIRSVARAAGGVYGAIDCMKLRKDKSIEGLTIEAKKPAIAIGEKIEFVMKNGLGEDIAKADLDTLNIVVDDSGILTVSQGDAKGINSGVATADVTATKGDVTITKKIKIAVTDTSGLWIDNEAREGKTVSFLVKASKAYSGGDSVIIATYEKKDGYLSSVKEHKEVTLEAISAGEYMQISEEFSELTETDTVQVFIFDKTEKMKTIYGKTTF